MRFNTKKRKSQPTINIVTLIDILAIILIFYVITTTFKREEAVNIALPESTEANTTEKQAPIVVSLSAEGEVYFGSEKLLISKLAERLKRAQSENPDLKLAFKPDKEAKVQELVSCLDAFKEAELGEVPMITVKPQN